MTGICSVEGCEKPVAWLRNELCRMHYYRWLRKGHTDPRRPRGYKAVHQQLRRERGPAASHECARGCGRQALHWSLDPCSGAELKLDGVGYAYSLDLAAYRPLCGRCHRRYDRIIRQTLAEVAVLARLHESGRGLVRA